MLLEAAVQHGPTLISDGGRRHRHHHHHRAMMAAERHPASDRRGGGAGRTAVATTTGRSLAQLAKGGGGGGGGRQSVRRRWVGGGGVSSVAAQVGSAGGAAFDLEGWLSGGTGGGSTAPMTALAAAPATTRRGGAVVGNSRRGRATNSTHQGSEGAADSSSSFVRSAPLAYGGGSRISSSPRTQQQPCFATRFVAHADGVEAVRVVNHGHEEARAPTSTTKTEWVEFKAGRSHELVNHIDQLPDSSMFHNRDRNFDTDKRDSNITRSRLGIDTNAAANAANEHHQMESNHDTGKNNKSEHRISEKSEATRAPSRTTTPRKGSEPLTPRTELRDIDIISHARINTAAAAAPPSPLQDQEAQDDCGKTATMMATTEGRVRFETSSSTRGAAADRGRTTTRTTHPTGQGQRQREQQDRRDDQQRTRGPRHAQQQQQEPQKLKPHPQRRMWKTAVDPKSGRTYYYDAVTRETQWRKPIELASVEERRAIRDKERKQREFFAAMESNILKCMHRGTVPGSPKKEEEDDVGEMRTPSKPAVVEKDKTTTTKKKKKGKVALLSKASKPTGKPVRTISSMNDALLAEMTKVGSSSSLSSSSGGKIRTKPVGPSPNSVSNFPVPAHDSSSSLSCGSSSFGSMGAMTPMVSAGVRPSGMTLERQDRAITQVRRAADEMTHSSVSLALDESFSPLNGEDLIDSEHGSDAAGTPPEPGKLKSLAKPVLVNRNTCGTIYVGSTMSAPDKDATIKCVCGVYRAHMLQAAKDEASSGFRPLVQFNEYEIFNDRPADRRGKGSGAAPGSPEKSSTPPRRSSRAAPSSQRSSDEAGPFLVSHSSSASGELDIEALSLESVESAVPSLDDITAFYRDVFQRSQMETDCIIMSLIYVERLIKETNGGVRPRVGNWRSVLFAAMVMASKVWDDLSMWNADFSQTCPAGVRFTLRRINELELAVLNCLKFSVKVPASEYAKYYFLLRSMMIRSGLAGDDLTSMSPLDVEGAKKLEVMSANFQTDKAGTTMALQGSKLGTPRSKSSGEVEWRGASPTGGGRGSSPTGGSKVSLEQVIHL